MDWGVVEDDEISTFKLKKETLKSTERERESNEIGNCLPSNGDNALVLA